MERALIVNDQGGIEARALLFLQFVVPLIESAGHPNVLMLVII